MATVFPFLVCAPRILAVADPSRGLFHAEDEVWAREQSLEGESHATLEAGALLTVIVERHQALDDEKIGVFGALGEHRFDFGACGGEVAQHDERVRSEYPRLLMPWIAPDDGANTPASVSLSG